MNAPFWIPLAVGLVSGAGIAALVAWFWHRAQAGRLRLELEARTATLEAGSAAEKSRREEAEAALLAARTELSATASRLAVAERERETAAATLAEQKEFLEHARRDFENAFKALAAEALKGNNEQFLELARQRMGKQHTEAEAELEERKQAIEAMLGPLKETLSKLELRTGEIEKAREGAYAKMDAQVKALAEATSALHDRTTILATALQGSQARGRWGEMALKRIVELAGMTEHCDFDTQVQLPDGRRPDLVVHLPEGRKIAVDAKAPLTAYLQASEATTDAAREKALAQHVKDLKKHISVLSSRDYAEQLASGLDMVVMFLPGEPFLAAAFAKDPELQVEALRAKVLIATPTTLVALLRTVAIYWQQLSMAENAERIAEIARLLYDRTRVFAEHLGEMGKGLQGAVGAYNRAVGSFERRLLPMAKQLEDLKVTEQAKRPVERPGKVEDPPREVGSLQPPEQAVVPFFEEI